MKLITFVHEDQTRLGALVADAGGEWVYDLNRLDPHLPSDMLGFLEAGAAAHALAGRPWPRPRPSRLSGLPM